MPRAKVTPPIDKTFPVSLESEKQALAAILRGSEEPLNELEPEDFYSADHAKLFSAAKKLSETNAAIGPVSLHELSNVPVESIRDLQAAYSPTAEETNTCVREIQRTAALRTVWQACKDTVARLGKQATVEEVLDTLDLGLTKLDRKDQGEPEDGAEVLEKLVGDFLERAKQGGYQYLSTGLKALDKAILGLRPGKVIVVAGRPSMGKTALSDSIRRAVIAQGQGVITFSLEMEPEELLERELAYKAQMDLRKVMSAQGVSEDETGRVRGSTGHIPPGSWFIDSRSYTIAAIRRRARLLARRMARKGIKLGLIIVDYIQLAGDTGEGREQSIASISRGCKLLAKELGCTVIAVSQLNRACEIREDRRPIMSDLRESGAIEQDADIVAFVYREHIYDNSFPSSEAELIIRKHRSGPIGTVHLHYNDKMTAFEDRKVSNAPTKPQ